MQREEQLLYWLAERLPYQLPKRLRRGVFYELILTWNPRLLLPDMRKARELNPSSLEEEGILALFFAWQKIVTGAEEEGVKELREALRTLPQRPEPYLFLGMYGLKSQNRALAYKAFSQALKYQRDFHLVQELLRRFGVRRPPLFSFLPRSHWLNVTLGRLRHRLLVRES